MFHLHFLSILSRCQYLLHYHCVSSYLGSLTTSLHRLGCILILPLEQTILNHHLYKSYKMQINMHNIKWVYLITYNDFISMTVCLSVPSTILLPRVPLRYSPLGIGNVSGPFHYQSSLFTYSYKAAESSKSKIW